MKIKHVVDYVFFDRGAETEMVYAYCGYSEESSGSGKHTVDVGEISCERCLRLSKEGLDQ